MQHPRGIILPTGSYHGDGTSPLHCPAQNRVGRETKVFLTYFRFLPSHTTVRAVRHTAVSRLVCPLSLASHIGYRHFLSIVGIRPIFLKGELLFGHLTTNPAFYTILPLRQCAIRPFALTVSRSATSASADSSAFVVTILADCRGLAG